MYTVLTAGTLLSYKKTPAKYAKSSHCRVLRLWLENRYENLPNANVIRLMFLSVASYLLKVLTNAD